MAKGGLARKFGHVNGVRTLAPPRKAGVRSAAVRMAAFRPLRTRRGLSAALSLLVRCGRLGCPSLPRRSSLPMIGCARAEHRALGTVTGGASLSSQRVNETRGAVMKVFVAGATGALGRQLVPMLVAEGHEVVGMTRTVSKQDLLRSLGARPVVADPLDPDLPAPGLAAILHLEQAVTTIEWGEGLALRYGGFYGPGTGMSLAPDAVMAALIRKRRFPIVGDGGGVWSFVHIEDAAAATAIAVEQGPPGIYYVVDDEPAPVREWLPVLASALGARPPRRIPRWLGRLAAGEIAALMMTEAQNAASNEKAKRELGWQPRYASWRQGFAQGL